jgi:hypothetical protein
MLEVITMMMVAVSPSETSVITYQTTQCYIEKTAVFRLLCDSSFVLIIGYSVEWGLRLSELWKLDYGLLGCDTM